MIKSEVKKKIEASATITNTMIVVIVVSRRVGQVTLAVSERTSCRNLNGLKAIVDIIRSVRRFSVVYGIRTALQRPALVSKDEPPSGLDCSGEIKAAPDIRTGGPAAGGGYVLRKAPKVKVRGSGRPPAPTRGSALKPARKRKPAPSRLNPSSTSGARRILVRRALALLD